MKVILKEDIQDLGTMGDMVNVADGYGRNFLLPKKLAIPATKVNIKTVEHEKRLINKRKGKILSEVTDIKNNLEKAEINIAAKVGENDKMFGSITSMDIEDKLKRLGFNIDRKSIMLDSPIKDLGIQTVKIKLHPEIIAEIKVDVVPE
ncbi:MAG: 50S ribosomal protein L9 [Candidatus Acidulodesulfobacterium ferriphilum]|jgi:ribosomal protein L9|uniref:Large ribosomal subunit protein bL9 n=1 Tax=Candidatus Acidulodesulfobacterium ferriphilum TaxID=2597223 RepID=A0A519BCB6_9DELT|nr:MAG: 50S ribosomal protein L9 [Candidatus Acidulodesulfobacterium ferriphilum]